MIWITTKETITAGPHGTVGYKTLSKPKHQHQTSVSKSQRLKPDLYFMNVQIDLKGKRLICSEGKS